MKPTYAFAITPVAIAIADLMKINEAEAATMNLHGYGHNIWMVNRINVPAKYRGLGHGSKLIRQFIADADEECATLCTLITGTPIAISRGELRSILQHYGFRSVSGTKGTLMVRPCQK